MVRDPAMARVERNLHPGAWWLWALGLATAATRTFNPLLLALILAVAGYVVTSRRSSAPWSRSYVVFLKLGLVVLAIRLVFQVVLGVPQGDTLLFTLPEAGLPDWAAGISLGGPVTLESVAAAFADGLRLATILACVGAANALANPKRLLASLPAALYEVGVAVVVGLSFAPSLVTSVQRIRAARRLRGRPDRGLRSILSVAMPVVEDALDRSLSLAAAMDSRGYGRRADVPVRVRHATAALSLTGLFGVSVGIYGLLDAASPAALGVPVLALGLTAAALGLRLAGRRTARTRYRPDRWAVPEVATAASGAFAAACVLLGGVLEPSALRLSVVPLSWPSLPWMPTVGLLVALLPAWLTPPPARLAATSPVDGRTDGRTAGPDRRPVEVDA
ncbi:MAG TPA: energy-coupling factor transporter transmembrane component T [Egicoccus sp.]|nr:energy-coupling factor transporter transmembrane component T [Egicoccus sp.]HSK23219.1 energy-coupling factor transporter transmembrane component T [Egicoccus sp.]